MIKPVGNTVVVSVTATSSTAVTLNGNDACCRVAFMNPGSTTVAVQVGQVSSCPAAVLPAAGTPSSANIVLPPSMRQPVVFSTPFVPFDVTAIGSGAGPSLIYMTPCEE